MKPIIVAVLLFIVASLGTAFYYLVRDPATSTRVVKTLLLRVGLSLGLMLLLFISIQLGWVTPHGFGR